MRIEPEVYTNSGSGGGFSTGDNKSPGEVAPGTTVYNPGTGQTGTTDGYGGIFVNK